MQTPTTHHTQPLPTTTRTKNRNQTTRPTTPKRCKAAPTTAGTVALGAPPLRATPGCAHKDRDHPTQHRASPNDWTHWREVEGAPSRRPYMGRLSRQPIPCARTAAPTPLGPGGGRLGKGWRAPLAPPPRLSAVGRRHADWPPALPSRARRSASEQANTHRSGRSASGQETTHWGRRIGYPNDLLPTPMTRCPPQCGHASADMAPPSSSREGTTTAPPLRDARMAATPCAPSPGPWSPPRSGAGWKPVAVSMAPTPQRHGLEAGRSVSRCRGGRPSAAPGPR